jgi:hypothetical protein
LGKGRGTAEQAELHWLGTSRCGNHRQPKSGRERFRFSRIDVVAKEFKGADLGRIQVDALSGQ